MQPDRSPPRERPGSSLPISSDRLGCADLCLPSRDVSVEPAWSPNQIAARARAAVEAGARKIGTVAGPSRAERQAVFGKTQEGRTLEGLARLWAEKRIGKRVVVMMGAGVSTGAGIPDIRDRQSPAFAEMQRQHGPQSPQDLLSKQKFIDDPGPLCTWLNGFLEVQATAQPTASHVFLKILSDKGLLLRCYTQNIHGLEVAAGVPSERVVMTHGSLENPLCAKCGEPADEIGFKRALRVGQIPQCCRCLCPVQPDLVFFKESTKIPRDFERDLDSCDLLLMMGTSLQLNPFSALAARVQPLVPRVLLHPDKVYIADCRHESRQLDFDSVRAYRDLWLGGDCDDTIRQLVRLLAWQIDLQSLEPQPGQRYPCSKTASDFSSPTLSTVSSGQSRLPGLGRSDDEWSVSACSSDGGKISELGGPKSINLEAMQLSPSPSWDRQLSPSPSWDRMNSRNKLPPPSSALSTGPVVLVRDMPRAASEPILFQAASNSSLCTMISEEYEDSETDMFQMQMVDDTTKVSI